MLKKLLGLVYLNGYTETALSDDTGLSRDTLDKVLEMLHKNPQKPVRAVQYIKLEQLFDRLNQKLTNPGKNPHPFQPRYCQEVSTRCIVPKPSQPLPIASTLLPPQQQLAIRLSRLNYTAGQAKFEDSLNQLKPAGAFLLRVSDTKVQHWLVRRLAEKVAGFENGKKLEINVACLGGSFEAIWAALARQLKLSTHTAEATIASLSELCQGKTVIIVLSRFQGLDTAVQQRVIREFWFPLVQKIRSQQPNWRSRMVLFLIQDDKRFEELPQSPLQVFPSQTVTHPDHPVRLEPLIQIAPHEIHGWFEQEGFELLAAQIGEQAAEEFMQQNEFSIWEDSPWTALENICNVFRTEISEIETYWKLAG